jgi:glycyl-tRNA synthetase beta subunit
MLLINERKAPSSKIPIIKNPSDAVKIFNQIGYTYTLICSELAQLNILFFDSNWKLKEGYAESMAVYREKSTKIRNHLTTLETMNARLNHYLTNETRPIPILASAPNAIDIETGAIQKHLKVYYKAIKNTTFPKLDEEIKRHKNIIENINLNIDRINEINVVYGKFSIRHVKNLSI